MVSQEDAACSVSCDSERWGKWTATCWPGVGLPYAGWPGRPSGFPCVGGCLTASLNECHLHRDQLGFKSGGQLTAQAVVTRLRGDVSSRTKSTHKPMLVSDAPPQRRCQEHNPAVLSRPFCPLQDTLHSRETERWVLARHGPQVSMCDVVSRFIPAAAATSLQEVVT